MEFEFKERKTYCCCGNETVDPRPADERTEKLRCDQCRCPCK